MTTIFPLHGSTEWQQSARHMRADVTLTDQGQLNANIKTWCTWKAKGFTGGCTVLVADKFENIIHEWVIWPLGVDGKWTGKSSREDFPVTHVPEDVVRNAAHLRVACSHMPKSDLEKLLRDGAKTVGVAVALIQGFSN